MNREHLRAFVWLRWRLRVNAFRKAGQFNAILFFAFSVLVVIMAVGLLVSGFLVGLLVLPRTSPAVRLVVWDGVIVAFLFFWLIGLMTDLQRSEGLAIDKVLHLPVAPTSAFVVNYVSSLANLTLIGFLPGMVGLILGEVCAGSVIMLFALPLVAAFVLAVTAVTYQFQGWLASLMSNPRRRRTIIVGMTVGFILLVQVPNLLNMSRPWEGSGRAERDRANERRAALRNELNAKKIAVEEYSRRSKELDKQLADERRERRERSWEEFHQTAWIVSAVIPPGWLAVGASELAARNVLPAVLGTLGLTLIGTLSLRRAYGTTLRLYTGEFTGHARPAAAAAPAVPFDPSRVRFVERRLPWVSDQASAVATAVLRSLWRAPEAKMSLVAPLIMLVVFGGLAFSVKGNPPAALRPLMAFGAGAMVLLISGVQLIGNQFGYDRAGFRAFVLSPVPRCDILLGKNIAVAPLALGAGLAFALLVGIVYPLRIDHYPAVLAQLLAAYLMFCLLANGLSIVAPIPMAPGSLQPAHVKLTPVLMQMGFLMLLPLALIPVVLPIGIEVLLAELAGLRGWPVSLILSLLVLAGTVLLYRKVLVWEGDWLAQREQAILEAVTSKGE